MTPFGKHMDTSVKQLPRQAVKAALADAQGDPASLQGAFFGNSTQGHMDGQHMIRGELALGDIGGFPVVNVENACASASTAFHLAVTYVRAGAADVVLAVGAEKMYSADKARSFSAFDGAWDVHDTELGRERLLRMGRGVEPPSGRSAGPASGAARIGQGLRAGGRRTTGCQRGGGARRHRDRRNHSVRGARAVPCRRGWTDGRTRRDANWRAYPDQPVRRSRIEGPPDRCYRARADLRAGNAAARRGRREAGGRRAYRHRGEWRRSAGRGRGGGVYHAARAMTTNDRRMTWPPDPTASWRT